MIWKKSFEQETLESEWEEAKGELSSRSRHLGGFNIE
jgi:hypothetical protein